jgi:hypothetical protein
VAIRDYTKIDEMGGTWGKWQINKPQFLLANIKRSRRKFGPKRDAESGESHIMRSLMICSISCQILFA